MTKKKMMEELHRTCELKEISIFNKFTRVIFQTPEQKERLKGQLDIIKWVIEEIEELL